MSALFLQNPMGLPRVSDGGRADQTLQTLRQKSEVCSDAQLKAWINDTLNDAAACELLGPIFANSPFLMSCALVDLPFLRLLLAKGPDTAFAEVIDGTKDDLLRETDKNRLMRGLRVARRRVALAVAIADIAGHWTLERVTQALSDFADCAVSTAMSHLLLDAADRGEVVLTDKYFVEQRCGYVALAMGKHGARELNYSSDIDLIMLYEPTRVDYRGTRSLQEFFVRMTQALGNLLQQRTADGYVCRVDFRLRPGGAAMPIAMPCAAAQAYYTARGETWERAALIKARAAAGDLELGTRFLDDLTPVVWRPELDFWTIRDILEVKRKINAHRGSSRVGFLGHNIKVGRGGIREVEFFAQTQQLIHGGRDPYLRCQRTVDALTTLAEAGHIDEATADALIEAYEFLRQLEHRLQMVGDRQTQTLPADEAGMARIAEFMGFDDLGNFRDLLFHHLHNVEAHYRRFFREVLPATEVQLLSFAAAEPDVPTRAALQDLGFGDPDAVFRRLHAWYEGMFAATNGRRSLTAFRELLPDLAVQIAKLKNPDDALDRIERFLATTSQGALLFPLLSSNPRIVALLVSLISTAPALADAVARQPAVLQAALMPGFLDVLPDRRVLLADCAEALRPARDGEDLLQRAQNWTNDYRFQVAASTMQHAVAAVDAGHALSDLADAVLQQMLAWLSERLGPGAEGEAGGLAIVAYGALGAREMTATSALKLLFVYDDGDAHQQVKIARRLTTLLVAPTARGRLCHLDLGACPWGERGPLVMSVNAFADSVASAKDLDPWQALCSARVVMAGTSQLRARIDDVLGNTLVMGRDATQRIAPPRLGRFAERPGPPGALDVRYRRGGLADLDAMLRWLQLRGAERHADIRETEVAPGLAKLAHFQLLDEARARRLVSAHQLLREVENISAFALGDQYDADTAPPDFAAAVARAGGAGDFSELQSMTEVAVGEITALSELIAK